MYIKTVQLLTEIRVQDTPKAKSSVLKFFTAFFEQLVNETDGRELAMLSESASLFINQIDTSLIGVELLQDLAKVELPYFDSAKSKTGVAYHKNLIACEQLHKLLILAATNAHLNEPETDELQYDLFNISCGNGNDVMAMFIAQDSHYIPNDKIDSSSKEQAELIRSAVSETTCFNGRNNYIEKNLDTLLLKIGSAGLSSYPYSLTSTIYQHHLPDYIVSSCLPIERLLEQVSKVSLAFRRGLYTSSGRWEGRFDLDLAGNCITAYLRAKDSSEAAFIRICTVLEHVGRQLIQHHPLNDTVKESDVLDAYQTKMTEMLRAAVEAKNKALCYFLVETMGANPLDSKEGLGANNINNSFVGEIENLYFTINQAAIKNEEPTPTETIGSFVL